MGSVVGHKTMETGLRCHARENRLTTIDRLTSVQMNLQFPENSLGAFYETANRMVGFGFLDAGKTMGLSAYGDERWVDALGEFTTLREDGLVAVDNLGFYQWGRRHVGASFQERAALARAVQVHLEREIVHMADDLQRRTEMREICLAGGVALNCLSNYRILEKTDFERQFVQPAAGDDGLAIGCALYGTHVLRGLPRRPRRFNPFCGREYDEAEILAALRAQPVRFELRQDLPHFAAEQLARKKVIGWFQGRSEFGPRALGARSILADPRSLSTRDYVNQQVKHREWFRPLAPAVLAEHTATYFDTPQMSPYMLLTVPVREEVHDRIPAVTHVDGSARLQTVHEDLTPRFHELIEAFHADTNVPVVLNTSFNRQGEPIVETPAEAVECLLSTPLDGLAIADYWVEKLT